VRLPSSSLPFVVRSEMSAADAGARYKRKRKVPDRFGVDEKRSAATAAAAVDGDGDEPMHDSGGGGGGVAETERAVEAAEDMSGPPSVRLYRRCQSSTSQLRQRLRWFSTV
jgi:hypothetical protein